MLQSRIVGMPMSGSDLFKIDPDYGALTTIETAPDGCRVLDANRSFENIW